MLLHHRFIDTAKRYGKKLAIHDFSTNRQLSYHRTLIAALLLAGFFKKYERGFIGIMLPTSAGCILATLAALLSGRIPVMINYSTGAADNARYAQKKCGFRTIITARALLEKIECVEVDGMVFLEDIMARVTTLRKLRAALVAALPASLLKLVVQGGRRTTRR
jgi:acyl-[acyl-carrier-protein]-phospholipid O-acyltransferase/long-chain-fatty-acid--[acyl-carrier-protein] ligase